jgi:phosphate transport system permease protein
LSFLFIEGAGVLLENLLIKGFGSKWVKSVSRLEPSQIRMMFDQKITNWSELGGKDLSFFF